MNRAHAEPIEAGDDRRRFRVWHELPVPGALLHSEQRENRGKRHRPGDAASLKDPPDPQSEHDRQRPESRHQIAIGLGIDERAAQQEDRRNRHEHEMKQRRERPLPERNERGDGRRHERQRRARQARPAIPSRDSGNRAR